jgi:hypothetical protein
MKRAVRTIVLVVAVACACLAMAAPVSTKTNEAGPMGLCRVNPNC